MTDEEPQLTEHAYDGIREYDNPLPGWWRMTFVGTIVFAGFYALYFHVVHWGTTPAEQYRAEVATYDAKRDKRDAAEMASISEDALAQRAAIPQVVTRGSEVFHERCTPCHKADGSGLIGPNLTDEFQLHGSTRVDIFKTVRGGVPGTAMMAWSEQLPPSDVLAVAVYAGTLRGRNLPGKPHEGQPVGKFVP